MSPILVMGANTAIRDAGELTRVLSDAAGTGEPLKEAVRAYESRMTDYAFSIVADSRHQRVGQR